MTPSLPISQDVGAVQAPITYPYTGWTLLPSFKPVEVTLVQMYEVFGGKDYGDVSDKGKVIPRTDIFDCQAAAIDEGWNRVRKQRADLEKRQAALDKKVAALHKAEGGLS